MGKNDGGSRSVFQLKYNRPQTRVSYCRSASFAELVKLPHCPSTKGMIFVATNCFNYPSLLSFPNTGICESVSRLKVFGIVFTHGHFSPCKVMFKNNKMITLSINIHYLKLQALTLRLFLQGKVFAININRRVLQIAP